MKEQANINEIESIIKSINSHWLEYLTISVNSSGLFTLYCDGVPNMNQETEESLLDFLRFYEKNYPQIFHDAEMQ